MHSAASGPVHAVHSCPWRKSPEAGLLHGECRGSPVQYRRSRILFRVGVRNLLGATDIINNAYESSRLQRYKLAGEYIYNRQVSRYLYAYPRTFYASVNFVF